MPHRIILHTGATKTGTSALQVGLAQNQQLLLDQGIFAPPGRRFEKNLAGAVSGGNAKQIKSFGRSLRQGATGGRRDPEKRLRAWLDEILSTQSAKGADTLVFSGEAIPGSFDVEAFETLKSILQERFDEISIIYYVRHLCDHAVSQYGEYVRRRRMKVSFSEFAEQYEAPFLDAISKMQQVFGVTQVKVLLFDAERKNLWPNFVRLMGADPTHMRQPIEVNRSLCAEEILLIRDLNQLGIKRTLLAKTLSHYSGAIGPATDNRILPTPKDIEVIGKSHCRQMEVINALLQDGTSLQPASATLSALAEADLQTDNPELPFAHMRQLLISALTTQDQALSDEDEEF